MARIADLEVEGVGEHLSVDLFFHHGGTVGQVDAVAKGFAHFGLAVYARQTALHLVFRDHGGGHGQRLAIDAVELLHDLTGLLQHGKLILAHRHHVGVEGRDIGGLRDGIGEKAHRQALVGKAPHLDLGLHRGVAGKTCRGDQIHIVKGQGMERREGGLHADGGLGGVDAHGEVVQHDVDDILPDLAGVVGVVGQGLIVGDEDVDLVEAAGILKLHPALQGAHIVAQMQAAGGTVAGKNDVFHGDPSANLRLLYDVRILYHRCADFSNRKIGGCCPGGRVEYCVRLRRPVGSCEAGARFESTRCQKETHHAECPALWC